ncbi:MAG: hypothetical protein ACRCVT_07785 [Leadbetterella sp.]
MIKILVFLFSLKSSFCSCKYERKHGFEREHFQNKKIGNFPSEVKESSGLGWTQEDSLLLTHGDSGNPNEIYEYNTGSKRIKKVKITGSENVDWEDITTDKKGSIFIGDFGDNIGLRQEMTIYKYQNNDTKKIKFNLLEKPRLSTKKNEFDMEAMFWFNDSLYLFTKSWAKGHKVCHMYKIPDLEGIHTAKKIDSILLNAQVTGADISPDYKTFALISYGKILLFDIKNNTIDFSNPKVCSKFARGLTEGLVFVSANELWISNEKGKIYKIWIPN